MKQGISKILSLALVMALAGASNAVMTDAAAKTVGAQQQAHVTALCAGEPCDAVVRGFAAFIDRDPDGLYGNGRACADCHMLTDSFQMSPKSVQIRWTLLQKARKYNPNADDPLFRPLDADDFRENGNAASDFTTLRENALVRITLPLPANLKLVDPASIDPATGLPGAGGPQYLIDPATGQPYTHTDIWRMTPSVHNVALTGPDNGTNVWPRGPNVAGGYQLDARKTTLAEQALGAFQDHAQVQVLPGPAVLADLQSFQRTQFSSAGMRTLAAAVRDGVTPLPDPDPPLNAVEAQGKAVFIRACAQCHGGPGQSTTAPEQSPPWPPGFLISRYHDINTACPRPVDRQVPARFQFAACPPNVANKIRTYEIHLPRIDDPRLPPGTRFGGARGEPVYKPGGETGEWYLYRKSSDPGRALLTGYVGGAASNRDDWQKLDTNGVHGVARTAPYFHNNSSATLRAMIEHYIEFYKKAEVDLRDAFAGPPFNGNPPLVPPDLSTDARTFNRIPLAVEVDPLIAYLRKL